MEPLPYCYIDTSVLLGDIPRANSYETTPGPEWQFVDIRLTDIDHIISRQLHYESDKRSECRQYITTRKFHCGLEI